MSGIPRGSRPSHTARKADRERRLAQQFVDHVSGTDLQRVPTACTPRPDFTFRSFSGCKCALEVTSFFLPFSKDPELLELKEELLDGLFTKVLAGIAGIWIDPDRQWPACGRDREQAIDQIRRLIEEGQRAPNLGVVVSTNLPGWSLAHVVVVPADSKPAMELGWGYPGQFSRPDLLNRKNDQLRYGRDRGVRGILLLEAPPTGSTATGPMYGWLVRWGAAAIRALMKHA